MKAAIPNPVMYARIAYNSVKQKIIRFWDALPTLGKLLIMFLLFPLFLIIAGNATKTQDNHRSKKL